MDKMKRLYGRFLGTTDEKNSSRSIRKLTEQKTATRRHARKFLKQELTVLLTETPLSTEDEAHASYMLLTEELRATIAYLTTLLFEAWDEYCDDDSFLNHAYCVEVENELCRTIQWYERATGLNYTV